MPPMRPCYDQNAILFHVSRLTYIPDAASSRYPLSLFQQRTWLIDEAVKKPEVDQVRHEALLVSSQR